MPMSHAIDKQLTRIKWGLMLTLGSVMVLAASCSSSSDDHDKVPFEQSPKGQADSQQVAQDKKDYAFAQRAEYTKDMKMKIASMNADIDNLSARVEKGSDSVKADAKPKLQALRDEVAHLNEKLDAVPSATESTWNDVKSGFNKGYASLTDGIKSARQWVSDKIAP
jgi:hypothetical protein